MTDRTGQKQISLWMPEDLHLQAKIKAVTNGWNLKDYIIDLMKKDLEENKNK